MENKDLLIVYNIFGISISLEKYFNEIDAIIWHIDRNDMKNKTKFVISSVLKSDEELIRIKEKYGDYLTIFSYDEKISVQCSFNKTVLTCIDYFKEEYNGYLYLSGGCKLPLIEDLFPRIVEKNNTNEFGIFHLGVDNDCGGDHCCEYSSNQEDTIISYGRWCSFNVGVFNRELKDFYGVPYCDTHGKSSSEGVFPFVCAALRKKYGFIGNALCTHTPDSDSNTPKFNKRGQPINQDLFRGTFLYGRTFKNIIDDVEALDAGIGYCSNVHNDFHGYDEFNPHGPVINQKIEKYDDNFLSLDERLKFFVRKHYYLNNNEFDYSKIEYEII